jgi:membrane associated rhomboid family serine protease
MRQLSGRGSTVQLLALIAVVTIVEFIVMSARGDSAVIIAAALVKPAVIGGQWWRLFTAALLHGSAMHLNGNMSALLVFGGLVEVYGGRRRVPLVFLLSALAGNIASTLFLSATSLGASGGILGLAGYALVIAVRQSRDASGWMVSQVARPIAVVLVMGVLGFFFIDNAGHIGGLVAGLALGLFAVPRSEGALAPARVRLLDTSGAIAAVVLLIAAVGTVVRLLTF